MVMVAVVLRRAVVTVRELQLCCLYSSYPKKGNHIICEVRFSGGCRILERGVPIRD